jgi:putative nucleotidyltransferase with HDIG domain
MNIKINKQELADINRWFTDYVNTFKFNNSELQRNIDIKKDHTYRVTEEIINIGSQLGLNEDERNLATIIALLHDIGRFEQFKQYKTFSDNKSENHAELGVRILKKHNIPGMLDKEIQNIIYCSVRNHNKPSLPEEETETCLFYSRLIRDADKLDILKVVTDYYLRASSQENVALVLELPDTPGISEEVFKALMNQQSVDMKHVRNVNDIKLLQVGWIYDINFGPTSEIIKSRGYLEKLKKVLPESKEIVEIFSLIHKFLLFNSQLVNIT